MRRSPICSHSNIAGCTSRRLGMDTHVSKLQLILRPILELKVPPLADPAGACIACLFFWRKLEFVIEHRINFLE